MQWDACARCHNNTLLGKWDGGYPLLNVNNPDQIDPIAGYDFTQKGLHCRVEGGISFVLFQWKKDDGTTDKIIIEALNVCVLSHSRNLALGGPN